MNDPKIKILTDTTLRKVLNLSYFKINGDFIENDDDISEYQIQHSFFEVLKNQLKNKGCKVSKEKGKVDITISDNEETFKYCFEAKSFIKTREKIALKSVNKDIEDLELFLASKKERIEKRAFIFLAIREKTLQTSKSKNSELAKYLNHKSNETPLQKSKGFHHKLISSYTIAHNSSIEKKNIRHQVRLFLIEIIKQ
jgi:hypothetical protein